MKVLIEMDLPDDVDPSHLLELMQEMAVEIHEDAVAEQDDDDEDIPLDEEAIKGAVSVQVVPLEPLHCTDTHCELPAGHAGVHQLKLTVRCRSSRST